MSLGKCTFLLYFSWIVLIAGSHTSILPGWSIGKISKNESNSISNSMLIDLSYSQKDGKGTCLNTPDFSKISQEDKAYIASDFIVLTNTTEQEMHVFFYKAHDPETQTQETCMSHIPGTRPRFDIESYNFKKLEDRVFLHYPVDQVQLLAAFLFFFKENGVDISSAIRALENILRHSLIAQEVVFVSLKPGHSMAIRRNCFYSFKMIDVIAVGISVGEEKNVYIVPILFNFLMTYCPKIFHNKFSSIDSPFMSGPACPECGKIEIIDARCWLYHAMECKSNCNPNAWCKCLCKTCNVSKQECGCYLLFLEYVAQTPSKQAHFKQVYKQYVDGQWIPIDLSERPTAEYAYEPDCKSLSEARHTLLPFSSQFQEQRLYYLGNAISSLTAQDKAYIQWYYDIICNTTDEPIEVTQYVLTEAGHARIASMISDKATFDRYAVYNKWSLTVPCLMQEPGLMKAEIVSALKPGEYLLIPRVYKDWAIKGAVAQYHLQYVASDKTQTISPLESSLYAYNAYKPYNVVGFYRCNKCLNLKGPSWFRHDGELRSFYKSYVLENAHADWCECICSACDNKKILCGCEWWGFTVADD